MKFYFNANNSTQLKALTEVGVKNILISYKYCKNLLSELHKDFEAILLVSGAIDNVDPYYIFVKENISKLTLAAQYDVPMNLELTIKYYLKGKDFGVSPVLTQNYLSHLSQLKLEGSKYICLGKLQGRIEEEEQIKKLPMLHNYHGLAKGRFIKNHMLTSVDSSAWLSGVRGRKTDVYDGAPITFGRKGQSESSRLKQILSNHKDFLNQCQVKEAKVIEGDYNSLLKITHALYYKPMFKALGLLAENYRE